MARLIVRPQRKRDVVIAAKKSSVLEDALIGHRFVLHLLDLQLDRRALEHSHLTVKSCEKDPFGNLRSLPYSC